MNDRLRLLREEIGLSRAAFGQKLGVSGDVINNLERGRVEIKEHIIKLICSEFSINEDWLRNGTGEMKAKTPSGIMEDLKKEFNLDDFAYSFVYEYLKLDEGKRNAVQEFFYNVLNGIGNREGASGTYDEVPKTSEELEAKFPPVDEDQKTDTG